MSTVLVCGGRDYDDRDNVFDALDALHAEYTFDRVIHGGAMGADYLAHEWATSRRVVVRTFMADWNRYGRSAGPIRNRQMLEEGQPDLVVAFPGGSGTANMIKQALSARVAVTAVSKNGGISYPGQTTRYNK